MNDGSGSRRKRQRLPLITLFILTAILLVAVLDWELSTLGHPYADLAYQCMQWRLPHDSGFRGLGGVDPDVVDGGEDLALQVVT